MRDFILLSSSSSSSSSISSTPSSNPNPNPNPNRHFRSSKSTTLSPPPPSSSPLSALASRSPPVSAVPLDPSPRSHLRYFADKVDDFAVVLESLVLSGLDVPRLEAAVRSEFAEKGVSAFARGGRGKVAGFAAVLGKLEELGLAPAEVFGGSAWEVLRRECRWILKSELLEEFVELVEVLSGFGFAIKELVKPSDVIKICVEKRQPKLAIRYACTLPHAHMLFCDTINEFGKRGDLVSAFEAYEVAKKNSTTVNMYLYRAMIDVCGRCHSYLKSRDIYEDLLSQKVTPNVYVFNSLMNTNARDLNYTLVVYRDMQNLDVHADMASYNILLKACCLAGRVDLAQDIYKEVQDLESTGVLKLDVFTYSTILKVLADAKLWQMALKVKEDMLKAGVTPNTITWSSLISACANAGIVEKALQLFEEMVLNGCEPNSQCCNILLHACVEACQYDRAFRLFESWKRNRVGESISKEDGKEINTNTRTRVNANGSQSSNLYGLNFAKDLPFTPTTTTYNILIKACGSNFYHAKALMEEMKAVGLSPNQITWSTLIDICGSSRNVVGALQILKSMRSTGIEPDVVAYTTVIKVCVENKNFKLAFKLFAEMKTYQIQPTLVTYNTLLRARTRYGSLQEVKQCLVVYQDMRRAGYNPNDYYLKQLIEEWCEGVLQGNYQKNWAKDCSDENIDNNTERPQSFLLEKVAQQLQKHIAESLVVDIQGLTKVEARILVLVVLRMIKENYFRGQMVNDDMLIVLGATDEAAVLSEQKLPELKSSITKLLEDELDFEVVQSGLKIEPSSEQVNSHRLGTTELPVDAMFSTRRPEVVIQRLKITQKSLHQWLLRKIDLRI